MTYLIVMYKYLRVVSGLISFQITHLRVWCLLLKGSLRRKSIFILLDQHKENAKPIVEQVTKNEDFFRTSFGSATYYSAVYFGCVGRYKISDVDVTWSSRQPGP